MDPDRHSHVLIAGAPRSGTTLLAAMVGSHPEVAMLNEDLFESFRLVLGKRVRATKLCIPNQIEVKGRPLRFALGFGRYLLLEAVAPFLSRVGLTRPKIDIASRSSLKGFLELPDSTIVGILRDPHDVLVSIRQRGNRTQRLAAHRWSRAIEALAEIQSDKRISDRLVLVDYDLLVTEPAKVMAKLLPAIGCDYDVAVLAGYADTPQYTADGILADRAGRRGEERFAHPLLDRSPALRSAYRRLLDSSISV